MHTPDLTPHLINYHYIIPHTTLSYHPLTYYPLNIPLSGFRPVRAFVGPYMTALEMTGVSLTLVRIQGEGWFD